MDGREGSRTASRLAATAGLFVLLWQVPALADPPAAPPRGRPTTFDGSCSLQGTVTFSPGATYSTQELDVDFVGHGTCTGTLNGAKIEGAPVDVHQHEHAVGSCLEARTTSPGLGQMTFPGGELLTYTIEFTYDLANQTKFDFRGTQAGAARGSGTFQTDRTPPDTLARCATPDGAVDVPMDIELTTDTPLVSKKR